MSAPYPQPGDAPADARLREYAALLAEASAAVSRQLDEVRLSLHILLENHFGTLNDNQEEMLAAARAAAEAAEVELQRLREIADLDRGALRMRRDRIHPGELLRALRPQLEADGARSGVGVALDVAPGLPAVVGDRVRLQEALELLLRHLVRRALPGTTVAIGAAAAGDEIRITVAHAPAPSPDADVAAAHRILLAHGGRIAQDGGRTTVLLPATPTVIPARP